MTKTLTTSRLQRARAIVDAGNVKPLGGSRYDVTSLNGRRVYTVNLHGCRDQGVQRCNCADARYSRADCQHFLAAAIVYLGEAKK